jgi:hypothetical protein
LDSITLGDANKLGVDSISERDVAGYATTALRDIGNAYQYLRSAEAIITDKNIKLAQH